MYVGLAEAYRLLISSGGCEIYNLESPGLDSRLPTRVHIQNYLVARDQVTRVPPLALLPEDLLDEGFDLKCDHAAKWVSGRDPSVLRRQRERFPQRGNVRDFFTACDIVQPCPASGRNARGQIGGQLEGSSQKVLPADIPEELFSEIIQRDGAFRLDGVYEQRPDGCPGDSRPGGFQLDSRLL